MYKKIMSFADTKQELLRQCNYWGPLLPEMKQAPLWRVSDIGLEWLVNNQRGGGNFLEILDLILRRTLPSRQERILDMLQSRFDPFRERAELVKFENALLTQSSDVNSIWYHNKNERIISERLLLSIQRRMAVLPNEELENITLTMPPRVQAVMDAHGGHTKS